MNDIGDMLSLIALALFAVFHIFGGFQALYDGWRPWKHGLKWWKFHD